MRLPLALAALLGMPGPLLAEQTADAAPWLARALFGQLVRFAPVIPGSAGRAPDYAAQQGGNALVEYVPAGETLQAWTQMHTLSGAQGLGAQVADAAVHAQAMAAHFLQGYRDACALDVASLPRGMPAIPGARASFAGYLACDHVRGTAHGESMVLLVIVGPTDTFTLQWAERIPAQPRPRPVDRSRVEGRLAQLAQASLCTPRPGETAPYPSCN